MNPLAHGLMVAQGSLATCVLLFAVVCLVADYETEETLTILRMNTATYMGMFTCACIVTLVTG